eukprot:1663242-Amphidinium_carterae.1
MIRWPVVGHDLTPRVELYNSDAHDLNAKISFVYDFFCAFFSSDKCKLAAKCMLVQNATTFQAYSAHKTQNLECRHMMTLCCMACVFELPTQSSECNGYCD